MSKPSTGLTPREIVAELDQHIIGQAEAKRAVAVALRNRWRRRMLAEDMRDEVYPKNILMIGPTGVGKTEIARRLAKLADAPLIKVEASKFTEVGYVGRDVESIVRDLAEEGYRMVRERALAEVEGRAKRYADERILGLVDPQLLKGTAEWQAGLDRLESGDYNARPIEVEVSDQVKLPFDVLGMGPGSEQMERGLKDMFSQFMPKQRRRSKMTVGEARSALLQEESARLVDEDQIRRRAADLVENQGIVFLDELDKIAHRRGQHGGGPDVSGEGVQRDLLPIVEGSTVTTKLGPIKTDHVLFIAAGAFHVAKPSDLIPELQGRFPIRVELQPLGEDELFRILTEPRASLLRQSEALLATEGVTISFEPEGIKAMAAAAAECNRTLENIGARRLHTILERVLEEISFAAPELTGQAVPVTLVYVRQRLAGAMESRELARYIL